MKETIKFITIIGHMIHFATTAGVTGWTLIGDVCHRSDKHGCSQLTMCVYKVVDNSVPTFSKNTR